MLPGQTDGILTARRFPCQGGADRVAVGLTSGAAGVFFPTGMAHRLCAGAPNAIEGRGARLRRHDSAPKWGLDR